MKKRVGVAEYDVLEVGTLSTSGLGSCVAVAVYEPDGPGGLLHAMLPHADTVPGVGAAKYVDTGVAALFDALLTADVDENALVAKIAGGSAMLDLTDPAIGERNVVAAHRALATLAVPVIAEDVGGKRGRSVRLSLPTGDFHVRSHNTLEIL